jgi:hypothetical protein
LNVSILPEDLKLDIIKALKGEEAKLERKVKNALKPDRSATAPQKGCATSPEKSAIVSCRCHVNRDEG